MKYKIFGLLVLPFVLVPALVVLADDPTSRHIDLGQISTGLGGPSSGVAVNVEAWDSAVGGTMLGTEPHSVDTDSSGTITNDNGFGDFELGRGSGGVDSTFFQNAAASPISRYLDVTQAGVSVLPGGTRVPFLTVPFALSVPLIHNFGTDNLFAGVNAGNLSTRGSHNTGVGVNALSANTTGFSNTASGAFALQSNTTGDSNTASGSRALQNNTTGVNNTASGVGALFSNNGSNNTAIGDTALFSNTTGGDNTASGFGALQRNTTGGDNTASGRAALVSNTTGSRNTASGSGALFSNNGSNNTASGWAALERNTTGVNNTASGVDALRLNTTGTFNTASGSSALFNNNGGSNTASGADALFNNTTGNFNTATGVNALRNNNTGSGNTASGISALLSNTTGDNNTAIGLGADVSVGNLTNATAIGNGAVVNASNKIRLGNTSVQVIEGNVAYTFPSDRNQKGNFRPVDGEQVLRKIGGLSLTSWNYIGHDPKQFRHYGPVAQDFFAAFGNDGIGTVGTPTTINSGDMAGILMIGVQSLTKELEMKTKLIDELSQRIEALERLVKATQTARSEATK